MAGKTNLSRIITCCFAVVCLVGIPAGGMSAAALAPEPVNGVGVDIQWLDFGSEYKNYWIQELSDTGYYLISMGADDEGNVSTTGVVNGKMEVVVEPDVFDVSGSSGDAYQMVVLRKGDTCYFISADGLGKAGVAKVDVSAYSELRYFHNGYANVTLKSNSMNGVIDSAGNLVFTNGDYKGFYHIGEGVFAATADADWGFETAGHLVDSSGRLLCATYYESISNVSEGMIRVSKNGKYGFVDLSGSDVVPMTYDKAYPYQDGVAAVQANGKWGLIGKTGDEVAAFAYDQINHLDDGLYCVAASDKYGVVNTAGETILPIEYDNVYSSYYINRGKGFAASKASETFLMDIAGEVVFSGEYSEMYFNSNGTVNVVKTVGGRQTQAVFDSTGNNLTGFKEFSLYYQNENLLVGVKHGEYPPGVAPPHDYSQKHALFDAKGNNLTGFRYSNSWGFLNDYLIVSEQYYEPMGLLNRNGAEVLPTVFSKIILTGEGYVIVEKRGEGNDTGSSIGYFKIPDSFSEMKRTPPVTVYLDGVELYFDAEPAIVNDRTMVPMRKIFETLGAEVTWDDKERKVTAVRGDVTVELVIGKDTAFINGEPVALDAAAMILSDRTLVPLRFVAEALDCDVDWVNAERRVVIATE